MAVLTLPTTSFYKVELEPDHIIAETYSRGGYSSEITEADPMYGGALMTTSLTPRQLRAWEAFISLATETKQAFDFVHPLHLCPSAYTVDTLPGGWDGVATIATGGLADLRYLVMAGLPIGLELRQGDRLSVAEDDYISYRMVAEDTTVASGSAQSVRITPRLPLGRFTVAALVSFKNPKARLRVVKNTWSAPLTGGEDVRGAFQVLEAPR